jgi:hypothetical protein
MDPQASSFVNELQGVLEKLEKKDSQLFKSGIELIKLTAKVGDRVEFSVVIAGKEAPKLDVASPDEPDPVK